MENEDVVMAPGAHVYGDVTIAPGCSLWFNTVVRGDVSPIKIGRDTNIQDNTVVHGAINCPINIGCGAVIGHNAVIHGCSIGNNTLVGMGSIIMNNASVGDNCIIGAGSLVTQGTVIPDGSMAFGRPAKVVRRLTEKEIEEIGFNARHYKKLAQQLKEYVKSL